jgi:hypothetical protein
MALLIITRLIKLNMDAIRYSANTYKDFTYNDITYNINKCDITSMFLLLSVKSLISQISYLTFINVITNVVITNVVITNVVITNVVISKSLYK